MDRSWANHKKSLNKGEKVLYNKTIVAGPHPVPLWTNGPDNGIIFGYFARHCRRNPAAPAGPETGVGKPSGLGRKVQEAALPLSRQDGVASMICSKEVQK